MPYGKSYNFYATVVSIIRSMTLNLKNVIEINPIKLPYVIILG